MSDEETIREALEAASVLRAGSRGTEIDDACFALNRLVAERDALLARNSEMATVLYRLIRGYDDSGLLWGVIQDAQKLVPARPEDFRATSPSNPTVSAQEEE